MTSNPRRILIVMSLLPALAACESIYPDPQLSTFGEANRQTMAAQVVNPAPVYDTLNPPTSGEHAGQAGKRYSEGKVTQPDKVSASSATGPS